mmetsp:Transcript_6801/g.21267  ORF Transcript_6801/g.21267 Transcript_6801/m.21267 type:complete len:241 (+) Transcript_6801:104-826(+)
MGFFKSSPWCGACIRWAWTRPSRTGSRGGAVDWARRGGLEPPSLAWALPSFERRGSSSLSRRGMDRPRLSPSPAALPSFTAASAVLPGSPSSPRSPRPQRHPNAGRYARRAPTVWSTVGAGCVEGTGPRVGGRSGAGDYPRSFSLSLSLQSRVATTTVFFRRRDFLTAGFFRRRRDARTSWTAPSQPPPRRPSAPRKGSSSPAACFCAHRGPFVEPVCSPRPLLYLFNGTPPGTTCALEK